MTILNKIKYEVYLKLRLWINKIREQNRIDRLIELSKMILKLSDEDLSILNYAIGDRRKVLICSTKKNEEVTTEDVANGFMNKQTKKSYEILGLK